MPINIRKHSDETIEKIATALERFHADHPEAQIDLYRQNPVSVRVRIIDACFMGRAKAERSRMAWKYLADLPDGADADISMLVLLTPEETVKSFSNVEFEDPVPSRL